MKFWKLVSASTVLVLSTSVNAALIDNGTYTTDSLSGLDWLDLTETNNQSYNQSPTLNPGWRHATHTEITGLLASTGLDRIQQYSGE